MTFSKGFLFAICVVSFVSMAEKAAAYYYPHTLKVQKDLQIKGRNGAPIKLKEGSQVRFYVNRHEVGTDRDGNYLQLFEVHLVLELVPNEIEKDGAVVLKSPKFFKAFTGGGEGTLAKAQTGHDGIVRYSASKPEYFSYEMGTTSRSCDISQFERRCYRDVLTSQERCEDVTISRQGTQAARHLVQGHRNGITLEFVSPAGVVLAETSFIHEAAFDQYAPIGSCH